MPQPILITGAARSGTSLVASIVHAAGAFGGRVPLAATRSAHHENTTIRDTLVKPLLRAIGMDPMGQSPLPDRREVERMLSEDAEWKDRWARAVRHTMVREGYSGGAWYYKDAKTLLMWPLWDAAFPDARWIIVRREDEAIIDSCLRTPFMRAHKTRAGWEGWVHEHVAAMAEMLAHGCAIAEVWSDRIVAGDYDEIRSALSFVGLDLTTEALVGKVHPTLYHHEVRA
jgi:hypothetical protein